jgi:tetratricopeptide (TPR) repeat protein
MIAEVTLILALAGAAHGSALIPDSTDEAQSQEGTLYARGTAALDKRDWETAATTFEQAATLKGDRADAALYWRAYALHKSGRREDALQAIATLRSAYPRSRWMKDAAALDLEIRQASGQAPAPPAEGSDDLKLLALGGLMNADPARALPLIKQMLARSPTQTVRDRAMFVLAQSGSPEAREVLMQMARGGADVETQVTAIRYLGLFGGEDSRQSLVDIYSGTQNPEARKAVLTGLMVAGAREQLVAIARTETAPELRREAINQLGVSGARAELEQLYQQDKSPDARRAIINALFVSGAVDQMTALATKETDPELRREAVQRLGLMGKETAPTLKSIYGSERDPRVKGAVLHAYFVQGNATALIEIARQEQDPERKKEAVQMLALMHSKEATDYMLELLK